MTAPELAEMQECLLTDDMTEKPFRFDDLGLVALPTAVSVARLFVRYTLERWQAPPSAVADAVAAAGELVALSVADAERLSEIRVRVFAFRRSVMVEVWDMAEREISATDDGGDQPQGIELVDILAQRWASGRHEQTRITWAEVAVYAQTPSGLPVRPQRTAVARAVSAPALDDELLRRIRDALKGL